MERPSRMTPLYQEHLRQKAAMIAYADWSLPVQYAGIIAEHKAVRESAGLFDVSHMGEIEVTGAAAEAFLNFLLTRSIRFAESGKAWYSPMCSASGGTVDDLIVYPLAPDRALLVVNAANTDQDLTHLQAVAAEWQTLTGQTISLTDRSAEVAQLALQGPGAAALMQQIIPEAVALRNYHFAVLKGSRIVSRTGYTGEDGFEIYLPPAQAPALWQKLLALGAQPAGLGARDILRLEAGMPLYGHELTADITPLEAGLGRFVNLDKGAPGFVGQTALRQPTSRRLVGLQAAGKAIPRADYPVLLGDRTIGHITSGGFSPSLSRGIGMALIEADADLAAAAISVLIRERKEPFAFCSLPFVQRAAKQS